MDATERRPYMFLHLRVMLSGIYAQKEGAGQLIATLGTYCRRKMMS
jgi:hypothetical protein